MMPSWARDTVTIHRAPLVDERGTQVRDYDKAETHEIRRCSFQHANSQTTWNDPRQAVTVKANLWLPSGSDIAEGDLVEFEGTKYAIDGAPHPWRSPSGRVDHIQCALIDWRD